MITARQRLTLLAQIMVDTMSTYVPKVILRDYQQHPKVTLQPFSHFKIGKREPWVRFWGELVVMMNLETSFRSAAISQSVFQPPDGPGKMTFPASILFIDISG